MEPKPKGIENLEDEKHILSEEGTNDNEIEGKLNVISAFPKVISPDALDGGNDVADDQSCSGDSADFKDDECDFPKGTSCPNIFDRIVARIFNDKKSLSKPGEEPVMNSQNGALTEEEFMFEGQTNACVKGPNESSDNGFMEKEVNVMINKICSRYTSVEEKRKLISQLSEECSKQPDLYETAADTKLMQFVESLVRKYCDYISNRKTIDCEDLCLLIPAMKFIRIVASHLPAQQVKYCFVLKTEVLYQLMRACTSSASKTFEAFNRLKIYIQKKLLVGEAYPLQETLVSKTFQKCFGIELKTDIKMQGFEVTLYDTSDATVDENVNKTIGELNIPVIPCDKESCNEEEETNSDKKPTEAIAQWKDVKIVRVFPLKYMLGYVDSEWEEKVMNVGREVQKHLLKHPLPKKEDIQENVIVGFWSQEVTFEEDPHFSMQCMRGQVLTTTRDWVMFWAIDLGVLGYSIWEKLTPLPPEEANRPPLIHIFILREPAPVLDEYFLEHAYAALESIFATHAKTGQHMLMSKDGQQILQLLQYPKDNIRVSLLKLVLVLTKNSKELRKLLEDCAFDVALAVQLEKYAHVYPHSEVTRDGMTTEIGLVTNILKLLLENKEDVRNWPERRRAYGAINMLLEESDCAAKQLLEDCLFRLSEEIFPQEKKQDYYRFRCIKSASVTRDKNYADQSLLRYPADERNRRPYRNNYNNYRTRPWPRRSQLVRLKPSFHDRPLATGTGQYVSIMDRIEDDIDENVVPVNALIGMDVHRDFYTRGYTADIKNDEMHEMIDEKRLKFIPELKLSEIICGMLNTGEGGSVYFGISSKKIIEGVKLTRIDKDIFRKVTWKHLLRRSRTIQVLQAPFGILYQISGISVIGVDRVMTRCIIPELRSGCYDIIYTPVVSRGEKPADLSTHILYVIEIQVRPIPHVTYMVNQNKKCFMREGMETIEIDALVVRKKCLEIEEQKNLSEIKKLQADNQELLSALLSAAGIH